MKFTWIKNTRGKPDAALTFAVISFLIVTVNVLLSTFGTISCGEHIIQFAALDSGTMAVYLGATFSTYIGRRWTDTHYDSVSKKESDKKPAASSKKNEVTDESTEG